MISTGCAIADLEKGRKAPRGLAGPSSRSSTFTLQHWTVQSKVRPDTAFLVVSPVCRTGQQSGDNNTKQNHSSKQSFFRSVTRKITKRLRLRRGKCGSCLHEHRMKLWAFCNSTLFFCIMCLCFKYFCLFNCDSDWRVGKLITETFELWWRSISGLQGLCSLCKHLTSNGS